MIELTESQLSKLQLQKLEDLSLFRQQKVSTFCNALRFKSYLKSNLYQAWWLCTTLAQKGKFKWVEMSNGNMFKCFYCIFV